MDATSPLPIHAHRTRWETRKHGESLLAVMKATILRDHALLISGFGKCEAYAKKASKGRNPQTSEAITLEPRKVVAAFLDMSDGNTKQLRQTLRLRRLARPRRTER